MECVEHLRWFNQVRWEERSRVVDCLVNVTKKVGVGYFLVEEAGRLKILKAEKISLTKLGCPLLVIGKAIKWKFTGPCMGPEIFAPEGFYS